MVNVLSQISGLSWPRTLQAAAAISSYYNYSSLAPHGCYLGDDLKGDRNCTLACQNLTKVFGSADTFLNCVSYPAVTEALASPDVSPADKDLADSYGILLQESGVSSGVLENTTRCLMGYCNSAKTCVQFFTGRSTTVSLHKTPYSIIGDDVYPAHYTGNFSGSLGSILGICKAVQQSSAVNADISGIGVYIAYFMQPSISIIAWFLLRLCGAGIYYIILIRELYRHWPLMTHDKARAGRDRWAHRKERITEGLIEFHKPQCFFMLAIQGASLIAKSGNLLDRSNLQQIYNDSAFMDVLSVGGHLLVTFILHTLRTTGHKAWYLFMLSTSTIVLSAAALLAKGSPTPNVVSTGYQYAGCGNVNPIALCLETDFTIPAKPKPRATDFSISKDLLSPDTFLYLSQRPERLWIDASAVSLTFSLIILGVFLLDFCHFEQTPRKSIALEKDKTPNPKPIHSTSALSAKVIAIFLSSTARWLCSGVLGLAVSFAYLVLSFSYLINLRYFQHPMDDFASGFVPINLSQWSFGQISAITVWIPPLFQYLYLEIYGMQGRRWHLPRGYKVVLVNEEKAIAQQHRRRSTTW